MIAIIVSLAFGAPIFIGLGGFAVLFFWYDGVPIAAVPAEMYRIVVSPTLPTIPLFTLAGYILAQSGASKRLIEVFRHWFGWIPGGTPVMITLLCGFFTTLTGGSGVTILALGGLLLPMLISEKYPREFSVGLITVSGSLGLLFPPSLPVIIYGVTAGVPINKIFLAGIIPGFFLVAMVAMWGVRQGFISKVTRQPFQPAEAFQAFWKAKWEVFIPAFILIGIFGGFTTLVEAAAFTVVYVLFVEVFVYKDLKLNDLPKVIVDCATLVGGVLIILGVAMGFTSYLVDAQVPLLALDWVRENIQSKYVFLLALNVMLLIVGCLMDIFSAIIVVVPLIKPMGIYFGIDPVHMAVIFIANLELGYLTPPVGMNLFLSAYRFNRSMPEVYKATLPFFIILLLTVLAITYIPALSLALL
ncbi:MAG TPA: TRAP transporter large permease subunit [Candidatus Marinimicrobia bacterium]|nr:TRAP transporter large permease subunit [Candidatus Neomarinimicrobiota bacterium]